MAAKVYVLRRAGEVKTTIVTLGVIDRPTPSARPMWAPKPVERKPAKMYLTCAPNFKPSVLYQTVP